MRKTLRRGLAIAATAVVTLTGSLTMGAPASAAAVCPDNHICFYQDTGWRGAQLAIPDHWLYDCGIVGITDRWASSVRNNTRYAFELWDLSASPDYLVGTAAAERAYRDFGNRGNDAIDTLASPPCL